jgi:hypothetical protein
VPGDQPHHVHGPLEEEVDEDGPVTAVCRVDAREVARSVASVDQQRQGYRPIDVHRSQSASHTPVSVLEGMDPSQAEMRVGSLENRMSTCEVG